MSIKAILNIALLIFLFLASSRQCLALQRNKEVSTELAKALGVTIRSNPDGENGVKVWIEFAPNGELKNFTQLTLQITAGDKRIVAAPLLTTRPAPDRVAAYFSADPAYLATSVLTIVVNETERTRIGYQFKVQDFLR